MMGMVEMSEKDVVERFEYLISQAKAEQSFVCEWTSREDLEFVLNLLDQKNKEIAGYKALTNKTFVAKIVKEFLERAKAKAKKGRGFLGNAYYSVSVADIEETAKEMGVEL